MSLFHWKGQEPGYVFEGMGSLYLIGSVAQNDEDYCAMIEAITCTVSPATQTITMCVARLTKSQ